MWGAKLCYTRCRTWTNFEINVINTAGLTSLFTPHCQQFRPAVLKLISKFVKFDSGSKLALAPHFILLRPAVLMKLISKICSSPTLKHLSICLATVIALAPNGLIFLKTWKCETLSQSFFSQFFPPKNDQKEINTLGITFFNVLVHFFHILLILFKS
jgi:hypothetical protein